VIGLSLVLPVALLLALGAGGAEPSLRVLAPLVTFGLPVVAMVAFWWEDWPGTALGPSWSGWADTVLIVVAAVLLTVLGQLVVGHADVGVVRPVRRPRARAHLSRHPAAGRGDLRRHAPDHARLGALAAGAAAPTHGRACAVVLS
jgi:hypothetical protein